MKLNIFIQAQFIALLIIVSEEENVRFGNSTQLLIESGHRATGS